MGELDEGIALASTKGKASHAYSGQATANNIEALGNKVRIHLGPGKPGANLDSSKVFMNDDVLEPGHRYVHAKGRGKSRIGCVSTAFDCKWHAREANLVKL
jgi:hypothetical protein